MRLSLDWLADVLRLPAGTTPDQVAEKLQALGFTRVMAYIGGFRAWDEAGYPADTGK